MPGFPVSWALLWLLLRLGPGQGRGGMSGGGCLLQRLSLTEAVISIGNQNRKSKFWDAALRGPYLAVLES